MTDFAWLIEAPGPNYLSACCIGRQYEFYWTREPDKALRFWSKAHADNTMRAVRKLNRSLFAFAVNLGDARPVEHGWTV